MSRPLERIKRLPTTPCPGGPTAGHARSSRRCAGYARARRAQRITITNRVEGVALAVAAAVAGGLSDLSRAPARHLPRKAKLALKTATFKAKPPGV